jgi:hypothetical protein
VYCQCNQQYYRDWGRCNAECSEYVNLGCFANICGPVEAELCG